MQLTVGSLFSGIGGLDLGLERAGMRVVWQSEIEPYCCEVLAHHWPGVSNLGDITAVDWDTVPAVDVICGGFPCQPASVAGKRKGMKDDRWLWPYFAAAIRVLRPQYVIAENVPGLLTVDGGRGFNAVLSDLAACGYDAEWVVFPASAVGAPHRRERLWIVAYTCSSTRDSGTKRRGRQKGANANRRSTRAIMAYPARVAGGESYNQANTQPDRREARAVSGSGSGTMADTNNTKAARFRTYSGRLYRQPEAIRSYSSGSRVFLHIPRSGFWQDSVLVRNRPIKPRLCALAHGIPRRVAKLRALGNAVVPQVAEYVGRCVMQHAEE